MAGLRLVGFPIVIFLWLMALAVACTSPESTPEEEALSPEEQRELEERRAEIEIGRDMAGRLLAHYGTVGDQSLIGYVNQVGSFVGSYSDAPDRRYMFAILDRETVNAFACPGGYILITKGALRTVQTESQLAHILGHEVAHVGRQHMYNTLKAMDKDEAEKNAKEGEARLDEVLRARSRPKPPETTTGSALARYLSGTGGVGINLLQAAKAGMGLILEKGLDQKLEYEADSEGTKYAIRAGHAPYGLKKFLQRLASQQAKTDIKNLGKTHPPIKKRISTIEKVLQELDANEIRGAVGIERWKKIKTRLPAKA